MSVGWLRELWDKKNNKKISKVNLCLKFFEGFEPTTQKIYESFYNFNKLGIYLKGINI